MCVGKYISSTTSCCRNNLGKGNQCFGSGSMWIRIEMAPLDPDPYWEYGSGSKTVKIVSKKEINLSFQVKTSIDHLAEGQMIFN